MQLVIVEDIGYRKFLPLTATRPVFDLLCGTISIAERIHRVIPSKNKYYVVRDELRGVIKERNPKAVLDIPKSSEILYVNGRTIISYELKKEIQKLRRKKSSFRIMSGDQWLVLYFPEKAERPPVKDLLDGLTDEKYFNDTVTVDSPVVRYPWDIIDLNPKLIVEDFVYKKKKNPKTISPKTTSKVELLNRKNIYIGKKVSLQPFTVIDASKGPVIINDEVVVQSHAYLVGPLAVDSKTVIKAGARIYGGTTIGYNCRVGGEVTASIIHRHSNKAHVGFLGHSYVGEWVNIGADTNNSNLKNDYGEIIVKIDNEPVATGKQFFGVVMGDHSRTAINAMINTGSIIGVGCSVFGTGFPPRVLPDFSWGGSDILRLYNFDKFIKNVQAMTARRGVTLSEKEIELLKKIYERRKQEYKQSRRTRSVT